MNKKGFTLVELMIVVVILGVLMATVLPRLTGAQARARDTGREADLNNIAQALQVYFDDNGRFPASAATGECLDSTSQTGLLLAGYLKSNAIPEDPLNNANAVLCATPNTGKYWYKSLTKDGVGQNAYLLCADAETYQRANALHNSDNTGAAAIGVADGDKLTIAGTNYSDFDNAVGVSLDAESGNNAGHSLFCLLN